MSLYSAVLAPFADYGFMRRALVASVALGLGSGPVGVLLMLRRMSLVGDAMSHAVLPGAAVGFLVAGGLSLLAMGLGGLIAGFAIDELDIAAGLLGGVAAAAGVIGGRALGSSLRTGSIVHTEDAPGALTLFDGAVLASPLFWMAIWFFG